MDAVAEAQSTEEKKKREFHEVRKHCLKNLIVLNKKKQKILKR